MKRFLFFSIMLIFVLSSVAPMTANAYVYGDPGKEELAEAYKELEKYVENDDWDNTRAVYDSYQKEFDLYFTKTKEPIEQAFENEDKQLLLKSYQAALRLNIERRLYFAEEQFADYGQAKLLLAKARGTFNVLEPLVMERSNQKLVDDIYLAFDEALASLGNPGLFGIGNKESDLDTFKKNTKFILTGIQPLFPLPGEEDQDEEHLTEENLGFLDSFNDEGNRSFWMLFSGALLAIFIGILLINRKKK